MQDENNVEVSAAVPATEEIAANMEQFTTEPVITEEAPLDPGDGATPPEEAAVLASAEEEFSALITESNDEPEGEEYDGPMGHYKILKEVEYQDEEGNVVGKLEVGSIQHLPTVLGASLVTVGDAIEVEPPTVDSEGKEQFTAPEAPAELGNTVEAPELKTLNNDGKEEQQYQNIN